MLPIKYNAALTPLEVRVMLSRTFDEPVNGRALLEALGFSESEIELEMWTHERGPDPCSCRVCLAPYSDLLLSEDEAIQAAFFLLARVKHRPVLEAIAERYSAAVMDPRATRPPGSRNGGNGE